MKVRTDGDVFRTLESFAKKELTIFAKHFMVDVCQGCDTTLVIEFSNLLLFK